MNSEETVAKAATTFDLLRKPSRVLTTFATSRAVCLAMLTLAVCAASSFAKEPPPEQLICCGADRVFIVDATDPTKERWSWNASDSPSIPNDFRAKFRSTDDCKPYAGGLILVTSSAQGVALIERRSQRCLFLAEVRNAHSGCLLPGNQIAVAASTGADEIQFFSQADQRRPAVPEHRIPLAGAHGTVWDSNRARLWALGTDELLEIKRGSDANVEAWNVAERYRLPSSGGHDLSPVHDDTQLFVTTDTQVLRFNMNDGEFTLAEGFGNQKKIKSVDLHPVTGRIVFHQALPDEWWSHTIRFNDVASVTLDEQRLYKIRWDVPTDRQ